jgi:chromosome segregation ATPase
MLEQAPGESYEKELPMTTKLDEAKGIDEAKGKVNNALSRLEKMIEQRLREETARADELAAKLSALESQHEELKRVASDVEARLERAMTHIRNLLTTDQR